MNEHRDKPYVKWGLTALAVIFISILLVVIFTNLPGFFGMLTALEQVRNRMYQNFAEKRTTWLFIDEVQSLFKHPAAFCRCWSRRRS